jgi:hypothetical protein
MNQGNFDSLLKLRCGRERTKNSRTSVLKTLRTVVGLRFGGRYTAVSEYFSAGGTEGSELGELLGTLGVVG